VLTAGVLLAGMAAPAVRAGLASIRTQGGRAGRVSHVAREASGASSSPMTDSDYPGTAVERMRASVERARSLQPEELSKDWDEVRS
jgi:hypothetical protein